MNNIETAKYYCEQADKALKVVQLANGYTSVK